MVVESLPMSETFNIYCDESCHLENDHHGVMVLGSVWCPLNKVREITTRVAELKLRHGLTAHFEMKWTKVSPSKAQFYLDVLNYFFDYEDLHFRAVVIPDKSKLTHGRFSQSHDDWYYKMYFLMLKTILSPESSYQVYLDVKDTRSGDKIRHLHDVLSSALQDHDRRIVTKMQSIRSHESALLQLADLLIGAIGYAHKGLDSSKTKLALIDRIKKRSGYSVLRSTLPKEPKLNLFVWSPQEVE
jgi:hypothetical protein